MTIMSDDGTGALGLGEEASNSAAQSHEHSHKHRHLDDVETISQVRV